MTEEGERYATYAIVAIWKVAIFFILLVSLTPSSGHVTEARQLFEQFGESLFDLGGGRRTDLLSILSIRRLLPGQPPDPEKRDGRLLGGDRA